MSEGRCGGSSGGAIRRNAAAPIFAIMALLTGVGGQADMLCSASHASPLSGMVPMYLLMSAFHSAPWMKLISSRRSDVRESY